MSTRVRTRKDVLALLGDPRQVDEELRNFRRRKRVFSDTQPSLSSEYAKKWVAVYKGKVRAHSKTFDSLLATIEREQLPRKNVIVRYIDKDQRIMIL